jgi:hypothetical protein
LGHHLLDGTAGDELDHDEGDQQDAEQGGDHQRETLQYV